MNLRLRYVVLSLPALVAFGCDADQGVSDPWMAPPQIGGKADAIATLDGADIPSAFADGNATYIHDRSIYTLEQVGALEGVRLDVATRADGIIDALPADGRLDIEELVRLEESPYFDLLFPAEQAALPSLWPLLEAPTSAAVQLEFSELEPLEIEERTVEHDDLEPPAAIPISEFAANQQPALQRVQLAFDADDDASTVSLDDLDAAIASPGAFLPTEIAIFEDARLRFIQDAPGTGRALVAAPTPGSLSLTESVGPVDFDLEATTRIEETQRWYRLSSPNSSSYSDRIRLRRDILSAPRTTGGEYVVLIEAANERESIFGGDGGQPHTNAGLFLVEQWDDGQLQFSGWAELPRMTQDTEQFDAYQYVQQDWETFDGQPLQRNIRETRRPAHSSNGQRYAIYTWDLGPQAPEGDVNPDDVNFLQPTPVSLPAGVYELEGASGGPATFEAFGEGALRVTYAGNTSWMHLNSNGSGLWSRRYTAYMGDLHFYYRGDTNDFRISTGSSSVLNTVITLEDRVQ